MLDGDDIPTTAIGGIVSGHSLSRRTRSMKGESNFGAGSSLLSSVDEGYNFICLKKSIKQLFIPSGDCTW